MNDFNEFYEDVKTVLKHAEVEEPFVKMIEECAERYKRKMEEVQREKIAVDKKLDVIQTQLEDILTKVQNEIDDMKQSIRSVNENEAQAAKTIKKEGVNNE